MRDERRETRLRVRRPLLDRPTDTFTIRRAERLLPVSGGRRGRAKNALHYTLGDPLYGQASIVR